MRRKAVVATRQLAKRQLTWLRRETDALWYDSSAEKEQDSVIRKVGNFLELRSCST
jgi:tRNA dimethylallyltransferase